MLLSSLALISLLSLTVMVLFKLYEDRSGRSIWSVLGMGAIYHWMEKRILQGLHKLQEFDSKILIDKIKESGLVLMNFYFAVQRIISQKLFSRAPSMPDNSGNKAASFYLKTIKEHKERTNHDIVTVEVDDGEEGNS
jgi:hypothetical protein